MLHAIHINKTIFCSANKLIPGFVVTNFKVVADQRTVQNIVKLRIFFTLRGCTNFIGMKVRMNNNKIMITLIIGWVFRI